MLIFRQLIDPTSSTYTYILGDAKSREAVIIDAVFEHTDRDLALLNELGLQLKFALETHVHADHVTGAALLRRRAGAEVCVSGASQAQGADRILDAGDTISFGGRTLRVLSTPGHTHGCISYALDDDSMVFTGDALLIRGCGRTDFQQGNPETLFESVHSQIFSLPETSVIYPGHDYKGLTATSVAEEKLYNPRLGGQILKDDFVGYMSNLGLAHPKQMDIAVPANMRCGEPQDDGEIKAAPDWAPLTYTFAGIYEVQPHWLEEHSSQVQIVDVRGEDEFNGILGHIPGATLLPLPELEARAAELSQDQPIVSVCRSGARSAQATVLLRKQGFDNVANLSGGMLSWRAQRLSIEGNAPE